MAGSSPRQMLRFGLYYHEPVAAGALKDTRLGFRYLMQFFPWTVPDPGIERSEEMKGEMQHE